MGSLGQPDIPGYIVTQTYYNLDSKCVITFTGKLDNIFSYVCCKCCYVKVVDGQNEQHRYCSHQRSWFVIQGGSKKRNGGYNDHCTCIIMFHSPNEIPAVPTAVHLLLSKEFTVNACCHVDTCNTTWRCFPNQKKELKCSKNLIGLYNWCQWHHVIPYCLIVLHITSDKVLIFCP